METGKFSFFKRAFEATKHELLVSMAIVIVLTIVLSLIFFFVENKEQPDVFTSYSDALVWAYTRYIEGGDGVFDGGPETVTGKVIASLFGFIGIAIVAIPAGLIGSGFIDAMNEEKHEKEIEDYQEPLTRLFKRLRNLTAKEYFNSLPDDDPDKGRKLLVVPSSVPIAKIQIRAGMDMKDIYELTQKHPEFRLVNRAAAFSGEEDPEDRFMLTHQPINRSYGYMKDRKSKITIVSTSSVLEVNTGWFAYHLAKMGGFNYISKDVEVDITDFDSFYSMSKEPKVNGKTRKQLEENRRMNKKKLVKLKEKEQKRKDFMNDLSSLAFGEDRWLVFIFTSSKNSVNRQDISFSNSMTGGKECTIEEQNLAVYDALIETITSGMKEQFNLVADRSNRYPFEKSFVGYKLKAENPALHFNALRMNVASDVVIRDNRKIVILYNLAQLINKALGGSGMTAEDAKDFEKHVFGYSDMEKQDGH